jgi:two-component system chemotaxis sensor kinase CheA
VQVDGRVYAVPDDFVDRTLRVPLGSGFSLGGRKVILVDETPVPVVWLRELLELKATTGKPVGKGRAAEAVPGVVIFDGSEKLTLLVDGVLDEQEIVLQPYGGLLRRVRNVSGTAILETGRICIVLNPSDLIQSAKRKSGTPAPEPTPEPETRKKVVLLVEDNITTRIQEKRILDGAGYEVITAVDGVDALTKLGVHPVDAVVSDIVMPNMDGLLLTERIRENIKHRELPVILVTSLSSEEDKRRGMEAGANAYIPKPGFDQTVLLETLNRLM